MSLREKIFKVDDELRIVYGEVYAPDVPDLDGDFMKAGEIRKMAHNFMRSQANRQIDTQHDNVLNGSVVVESFIVDWEHEIFLKDSWVVGVFVIDEDLWAQVKDGTFNGFSMEAFVRKKQTIVEVEIPRELKGLTIEDDTDHIHEFMVNFSVSGKFMGGRTNFVDGHFHVIRSHTVTEKADDHHHRFSILEEIKVV